MTPGFLAKCHFVEERLQKLREQRERTRLRSDKFSLFQLLQTSLARYIDLSGTLSELDHAFEETAVLLDSFYDQLDQDEEAPEEILVIIESALEIVDLEYELEEFSEEEAKEVVQELTQIEAALERFDLTAHLEASKLGQEKRRLTARAESLLENGETENGRYELVADYLEDFLAEKATQDELLEYLTKVYHSTLERLEDYDKTLLTPEQWTLEVALADELMLEGFSHWLDGLEELCAVCQVQDVSDDDFLVSLERLRLGNKSWLLVEKLTHG